MRPTKQAKFDLAADVRSDEPSNAQVQAAIRTTSYPLDPRALGDAALRRARVRARTNLSASYAQQQYALTWGDARMRLVPGEGTPRGPRKPVYFVSGWHAFGHRVTYEECRAAQAKLRKALTSGRHLGSAVAFPSDRRWYEQMLFVPNIAQDQVLEIALATGQPAVVRWTAGTLSVLPTGLVPNVHEAEVPAVLTPDVQGCPIRVDTNTSDRCVLRGGPFGSAAIHAGALSAEHRSLAIQLLGCGPCEDGRLPSWGNWGRSGGPILLSPVLLASRYGGASWR